MNTIQFNCAAMDNHSHIANTDIDSKRLPSFLLGIILALSILYVALEYTSVSQPYTSEDSLDDMVQDLDMQMPAEQRGMISATKPQKTVTSQIKAVEKPTDAHPEEITPTTPTIAPTEDTNATENHHATEAISQTPVNDKPISFRVVEEIPQFEGGMEAFTKWLTQNLCYPAEAQRGHIQGKVVVSFIINRDGSISSPKVEQSVHPLLDREALRVVRMMPKWTPGKINAKPCRTLFAIPIVFQL